LSGQEFLEVMRRCLLLCVLDDMVKLVFLIYIIRIITASITVTILIYQVLYDDTNNKLELNNLLFCTTERY
jgi:hypothetical protein